MKLTVNDLERYRRQAKEAKLKGAALLYALPDEDVMRICNGIGPEWFPSGLRALVDKMHPSLVVVAMIHDIMYYLGDGTDEDFRNANEIFRENGSLMADANYGWYNPARYKVKYDAWKFGNLCDGCGRMAYDAAIQERKSRKKG